MLWIVSQRMIAKHGFIDSLFPPPPLEDGTIPIGDFYRSPESLSAEAANHLVPKHGNSLMVQLVINGMKLQQCRPGFFEARDAIIQADQVLTGGENFCDLWLAFAEKGLGVDATVQGRTPWGGGVRKDVSTSFYMTHDFTSLNIYRYRVSTSRMYAVPRRSQSRLRNHHQTTLARTTQRMTVLGFPFPSRETMY